MTMFMIWLLSGLAGDLYSTAHNENSYISIGSSTSIFGCVGALAGFLILNWKRLDRYFISKKVVSGLIIGMILFNMLLQSTQLLKLTNPSES